MGNATDKDSHVERIGPEGLQVSSSAGSLAGYAQRVLHPEQSAGQLTGCPLTLQSPWPRRHCLWADTAAGSSPLPASGTCCRSELSTPSSAPLSFRLHLTRLQRQPVEDEAFPKRTSSSQR